MHFRPSDLTCATRYQAALDLVMSDAADCPDHHHRDLVPTLRAILASGRCGRDELKEAPTG